jgi:hypothetical protein
MHAGSELQICIVPTSTSVIVNKQIAEFSISDGSTLLHPEYRDVSETAVAGAVCKSLGGRNAALLTGEENRMQGGAFNAHSYLNTNKNREEKRRVIG